MKKSILLLFAFLITVVSFAQQKRELKHNKETNLSQTGSYTTDGKLQGAWLSYDTEGKKIVSANYDNGKKVGKWIHWIDGKPKEVDYSKNVAAL